jgi:hypothetical protein
LADFGKVIAVYANVSMVNLNFWPARWRANSVNGLADGKNVVF